MARVSEISAHQQISMAMTRSFVYDDWNGDDNVGNHVTCLHAFSMFVRYQQQNINSKLSRKRSIKAKSALSASPVAAKKISKHQQRHGVENSKEKNESKIMAWLASAKYQYQMKSSNNKQRLAAAENESGINIVSAAAWRSISSGMKKRNKNMAI